MGKTSLLEAFSDVGLASKKEITEQELREKKLLRSNQERLLPKTVGQLCEAGACYDFFARLKILFGIIENDPSEKTIASAIHFVKKSMFNGQAGRNFYDQLVEFQQGKTDLPTIKAKWPKILK